jgi:type IV secretion system protein VirB4
MFGLFRDPPRFHQYVPWRFRIDPETVVVRGGALLKTAHLSPRDLESSGPISKDMYHEQLGQLIQRMAGGFSIWWDEWRWRQPNYTEVADFQGCVGAEVLDAERRRRFASLEAKVFENSIYLTIGYEPEITDTWFEWLVGKEGVGTRAGEIASYNEAIEAVCSELKLIVQDVEILTDDALGTYYSWVVNLDDKQCHMPKLWIAEQIASKGWRTGLRPMIGDMHLRTVEVYAIGALTADTLEYLHRVPFEGRWCVRFDTHTREDQAKFLQHLIGINDQKRKNWFAATLQWFSRTRQDDTNLTAVARKQDAQDLKLAVEMAQTGFVTATVSYHTWRRCTSADPTKCSGCSGEEQVEINARHIAQHFKDSGCRAEVAKLSATLAPLADIPGNDPQPRHLPTLISQLTRLAPVTGIIRGALRDAKWDGPALLVGSSRRGQTIRFSYHSPGEDLGNTCLIGQSGGGKSALLAYMAAESMKYPNSRVIFFDRHQSFMPACACLGGDWLELVSGQAGVQPLRNIHDPEQFTIAVDWLMRALEYNNVAPNSEIKRAVSDGCSALTLLDPDERTISTLIQHCGGSRAARDGLSVYTKHGQYGALLDGVVASYGKSRVVGIECNALMRLEVAPLVITAIFIANQYERMRSGDPFVVFFDEAKAMLTHTAFSSEIDYLAREIRKANGVLVLATQSAGDFDFNQTTRVIFSQMANKIYLPDPDILDPQTKRFYLEAGLEDEQIHIIAEAVQKRDYFISCRQYKRMVQIELGDESLWICGRTSLRDRMVAKTMLAEGVKPGEEFLNLWLDHCRGTPAQTEAAA